MYQSNDFLAHFFTFQSIFIISSIWLKINRYLSKNSVRSTKIEIDKKVICENAYEFYYFQHERCFNENYVKPRSNSIRNFRKVFTESDELQNRPNASRIENGQLWNAKRTTVSGFPEMTTMNQLHDGGNHSDAKDSTNNEKRKLTR